MPGKWFEEFVEGELIEHAGKLSVTQEANAAFCAMTLNEQPLHLDANAARQAGFKDVLVNGLLTFSASVGMTVPDTTEGTLIANLGYEDVVHPAPVHPGDLVTTLTRVISKRASSKPGRGLVTLEHIASNQDGVAVCKFRRTVLVRCKPEANDEN